MAQKGPLNPSQLSVQQLSFLTKQLEEENQVLTSNFQQLKMAQQKFTVSAGVVGSLATEKKGAWCPFQSFLGAAVPCLLVFLGAMEHPWCYWMLPPTPHPRPFHSLTLHFF